MALIKLGSIVTRISGKVGGQQFGTTAAGSYMKNSGTPRKSITLLQQTKMQKMADTSQAWRQLTPTQRELYRSASSSYPYLNRVGETKFYSGYAIFCQLRNNQINAGLTPQHLPLPKFSFTAATTATLVESGTFINWTFNPPQNGVEYRLFLTRPASAGVTSGYKNAYFVHKAQGSQLALGTNVLPSIQAKFGAFPSSSQSYWRVDAVHTSSGQILKGIATGVLKKS